jgi:hypothetical protein
MTDWRMNERLSPICSELISIPSAVTGRPNKEHLKSGFATNFRVVRARAIARRTPKQKTFHGNIVQQALRTFKIMRNLQNIIRKNIGIYFPRFLCELVRIKAGSRVMILLRCTTSNGTCSYKSYVKSEGKEIFKIWKELVQCQQGVYPGRPPQLRNGYDDMLPIDWSHSA